MPHPGGELKRELGVFHAVLLGLGSILGTGVFVSIGIAAGVAGPAVLVAIVLAALLALCNGLSSAQLAAAHPVAGGTYEYGYKYLHPKLGFTAGWLFLLAKSASAATAALGVAVYVAEVYSWYMPPRNEVAVTYEGFGGIALVTALLAVVALTTLVILGVRRSAIVNTLLVAVTLSGLIAFVLFVFAGSRQGVYEPANYDYWLLPYERRGWHGLMTGSALMFVAFTGYGRIATLGEEVHRPRRTIPAAIIFTLVVSTLLYLAVGYALIQAGHSDVGFSVHRYAYGQEISALLNALDPYGAGLTMHHIVGIAAITAMLGVLLNLLLGLSRVALAMGRRGDLPGVFAKVNAAGTTPVPAVLLVAGIIAALTLVGDVKATWSFSAFTVLIYYGITNLACLRLAKADRLYPRFFAWAGLGGCLFLAWWVEPRYWIAGLVLIGMGLVWHSVAQRFAARRPSPWDVCAACGYDLRASSGCCPECGAAIPAPGSGSTRG